MPWVMLCLGSAFAGLVVIAACAVRVFVAVRDLGRQIERTRARLEPGRSRLAERLENLERRSSETSGATAYDLHRRTTAEED